MPTIECLETKIEKVRLKMYEAYSQPVEYHELLKISQELDDLLNQLERLIK
ncbi:aspartyl-phosphate phosphatase Spo0E family protein [Halobacillus fulvus]|nr:aspartyl-phosphate phosphatase Spo0E family protein [Halobacillus fulvus]